MFAFNNLKRKAETISKDDPAKRYGQHPTTTLAMMNYRDRYHFLHTLPSILSLVQTEHGKSGAAFEDLEINPVALAQQGGLIVSLNPENWAHVRGTLRITVAEAIAAKVGVGETTDAARARYAPVQEGSSSSSSARFEQGTFGTPAPKPRRVTRASAGTTAEAVPLTKEQESIAAARVKHLMQEEAQYIAAIPKIIGLWLEHCDLETREQIRNNEDCAEGSARNDLVRFAYGFMNVMLVGKQVTSISRQNAAREVSDQLKGMMQGDAPLGEYLRNYKRMLAVVDFLRQTVDEGSAADRAERGTTLAMSLNCDFYEDLQNIVVTLSDAERTVDAISERARSFEEQRSSKIEQIKRVQNMNKVLAMEAWRGRVRGACEW